MAKEFPVTTTDKTRTSLDLTDLVEKGTPINADFVPLYDSADSNLLKKAQVGNLPGGGGGGLTMIAQISISFTATIGERQLFDPSPGSRTASGPASGMTLGDEFAVMANTEDVTPWTMAKGDQATSIQHPQTLLFVSSFIVDSGAIDLHYGFDGGKLVLI